MIVSAPSFKLSSPTNLVLPIVFCLAFAISMLGISTRSIGYLAGFWPANAAMLGLFLRFPHLSTRANWMAAVTGFLLADLLTGNSAANGVLLAISNFAGIGAGYFCLRALDRQVRQLSHGMAVVIFFTASIVAALGTATLGAEVSVLLHGRSYGNAFMLWFSSELTNYVTITPVILSIPQNMREHLRRIRSNFSIHNWEARCSHRLFSVLLLIALSYGSQLLGGPGAFVFPLPALILVAMVFSLSTTTVIVLIYTLWCYAALLLGVVDTNIELTNAQDMMSIRLGITLLALSPLTVASMNVGREALIAALDKAATRDGLTGIFNRRAFLERAQACIDKETSQGCTLAMMLDIDHFKAINDTHGHAGGDEALVAFAAVVTANLRAHDLFGRLGGEEFAILAPVERREEADALIERVMRAIRRTPFRLANGQSLMMTASIGAAISTGTVSTSIEDILGRADEALYRAKNGGRDRAETTVL